MSLNDTFTSTGAKFFAHQEAMTKLRNGSGQPITTHVMLTDICNHTCAFCSVQARAGDSLPFSTVMSYLDTLIRYRLRSVILSGGGNPILYKCKKTGKNFNDVVDAIHERGLEIGLITNGMPLRKFESRWSHSHSTMTFRESWATVRPETLDKLTWVRISMAGLDHDEREVYVPDIDPSKTTLGFSYVAHDIYDAPEDPHHGKVSTEADLLQLGKVLDTNGKRKVRWFDSRIPVLTSQIAGYVETYKPSYVRLLPNCLEPSLIQERCLKLQKMADDIDPNVVFVQYKPPAPPKACYLGYIHPVLNCDGYVYPCDSCVLNDDANHQFTNPWRICHWSDVASLYNNPVRSLITNTKRTCPGCVFTRSNEILGGVVDGTADITPPSQIPEHVNFV